MSETRNENRCTHKQFGAVFGRAFVINLASRPDRMIQFRKTMGQVGIKEENVQRFDAVLVENRGWLGCVRSHMALLERAIENDWHRITVFEDDFIWRQSSRCDCVALLANLIQSLKTDFDVFMFGSRTVNYVALSKAHGCQLVRVLSAYTSSGYAIQRHYYETLLKNFKECEKLLDENVKTLADYRSKPLALDIHWQTLQRSGKWISTLPTLGKQSEGYSDIEGKSCVHNY